LKRIEDLYYPKEIREEVAEQTQTFSLNDFYLCGSDGLTIDNYALYMITPRQRLSVCCSESHGRTAENILFAIYSDYNYVFKANDWDWRATALAYGDIIMQLMSKHYSVIWLPKVINEFQYEELVKFYNLTKQINMNLDKTRQISFRCGYYGDEFCEMSLDEAIHFMKDKVCEVAEHGETLIDVKPRSKTYF